jgi:hypothetical protein
MIRFVNESVEFTLLENKDQHTLDLIIDLETFEGEYIGGIEIRLSYPELDQLRQEVNKI